MCVSERNSDVTRTEPKVVTTCRMISFEQCLRKRCFASLPSKMHPPLKLSNTALRSFQVQYFCEAFEARLKFRGEDCLEVVFSSQ